MSQTYKRRYYSIIIDKINELNNIIQREGETLRIQKAMLDRVMDALNLPPHPIETEDNRQDEAFSGSNAFDILGVYMRPNTRWDPPGPQTSCTDDEVKNETSSV